MAAYSARHYGERTWRLRRPRVIVEHVAVAGSAAAVFNAFAPDHPDPELHELPNVCAHFVVDSRGRVFRLVNLRTRCRHTVGLNWTAIGIEHTGYADGDVLGNRRQLRASLRLTPLAALQVPDQVAERDRPSREPPLPLPPRARAPSAAPDPWRLPPLVDARLPQAAGPPPLPYSQKLTEGTLIERTRFESGVIRKVSFGFEARLTQRKPSANGSFEPGGSYSAFG